MSELKTSLPKIVTGTVPGPKSKAVLDRRAQAYPAAIKCGYPCVIKRGEGAMFEDLDGNIFLDWIGGVGVLNIGYSRPELIDAVKAQADKFFHAMQNIIVHEGFVELAEKMNQIVPVKGTVKQTMFANSGAECDENAVKIAKAFTKRPNIIVFSGAFHGRTAMTMAMTAKKAYSIGMGPFPEGIYRADFPYLYRAPEGMTEAQAIDFYINKLNQVFIEATPPQSTAAIVVEPVQGEGGFVPLPIEYVKALRKICDEHGILLIADEVQSGWGRSGRLFTIEYWAEAGCPADIMTTAKSIAGGLPLSAVTARKEIFDAVPGGTIGGTFNGNPLSCASALALIDIMQKENLPARALAIADRVNKRANEWKAKFEAVGDVRGIGAMLGIEFVTDKKSKTPDPALVNNLVAEAAQNGLLLESAGTYGNCIRFLAPLVITDAQIDAGLDIFEKLLTKLAK
jgi:4-aminobutyrate aminotransferase/(S)-3-amino-2-methylpropionate transaminase